MPLLLLLVPVGLLGCSQYTLCYEHPTYGKLCVTIDGTKFVKKSMTPQETKALTDHEAQAPK
jgi:hypothetical protein